MAEGKESFLLYRNIIHMVRKMPRELRGDLFLHILEYVNDENPQTDDLLLEVAFEPIKQTLKRDLQRYEAVIERNKKNGKKGGRPPKKRATKPKKPNGLLENPTEPKKADMDMVMDMDIEGEVVNDFAKNTEMMNQIVENQSEHATWIETAYRTYKLEKMKLGFALKSFNDSLVLNDKVHKSMREYKQHFFNWMNTQEAKGKLESLKR